MRGAGEHSELRSGKAGDVAWDAAEQPDHLHGVLGTMSESPMMSVGASIA